jgi:uncharacterized protein YcbX
MTTIATITDLFVYPVKSTRAVAKSNVRITGTGFEWDRQWMAINANGVFLSQRTHPQLARIVPEVTANALVLTAPNLPPLQLPHSNQGERVAVRVHRDACVGVDQGATANEWMSRALGESVRLVRVPPDPLRRANPAFAGTVSAPMGFADGYPVLVCNRASLDDLNGRMPEAIPMERFRPNIVLEGLPAWAEDRIDSIQVGDLTLRLVKPCVRCTIPSVDQQTGLASTDPAPVLKTFRFSKALLGITFGENAVIVSGTGCEIERGADCHVTFEPAAATPA